MLQIFTDQNADVGSYDESPLNTQKHGNVNMSNDQFSVVFLQASNEI